MSILEIIALAGIAIGLIAFFIELLRKHKRSYGICAGLIVASFALLLVTSYVQKNKKAVSTADNTVNQQQNIAEPSTEQLAAADDDGFEIGDPVEDEPVAAPVQAAENEPAAAPEQAEAPEQAAENEPAAAPEQPAAPEPAQAAAENDPNAPTADAGDAINDIKVKEPVTFTGKKSKAAKGSSITAYHWDFGDGNSADGKEVKHAYDNAGDYTATLTVTDKEGRKGSATRNISVDRPENKVKFVDDKLPNVVDASSSQAAKNGTMTKTFKGSKIALDVTGFMAVSGECRCSLVATLKGPNCDATKSKAFEDENEGRVSVKLSCDGEVGGEYTWTVERKASGSCYCTWKNISIEGYEH